MGMLKEFKEFALQGNVIELAIGIIIGAAFGAIVSALVDNIFMPVLGILTGGIDLKSLSTKAGSAEVKYGLFLQAAVTFLIIAFVLFLIVKVISRFKKKTPPSPTPISNTDKLLGQILEELKRKTV